MNDARGEIADQIDFELDVWCNADDELEVLRQELISLGDDTPHQAAIIYFEIGRILLALGDEVEATQHLLRSYTLRPQFRPTINLAQQIYRRRGDNKLVIKLLDAEARATRDPLTRCALFRQHAHILWLRQGDPDAAAARLKEALRLDAGDLTTLKLIDILALIREDHDDRRHTILRQIEVISDSKLRAGLLVDLALNESDDRKTSIETLQRARELRPDNISILILLEQELTAAGRLEDLTKVLLTHASLDGLSKASRAKIHARVGRIYRGPLDDPGPAIEHLLEALALEPNAAVAADCFELLVQAKQHRAAVEVGAKLFDLDETPRSRTDLACRLGDLCRVDLDDSKLAIDWYRRCLRHAPSYQPALIHLAGILEDQGDLDALLVIHRADLATSKTPAGRARRLYRIATLLERLGNAKGATEALHKALAAQPGFLPAIAALERLLTEGRRWAELLKIYDVQIDRETDDERVTHILETMATISYHQMDDVNLAIETYKRILERDPENLSILRATARLCAEAQRWDELQEINEREVQLVGDPQRRAEILQRAGEIWEQRILDLDHAVDSYHRALAQNPRYLPALRALGRLYRQKARWPELIEMHRSEIAVTSDPEQIIVLLQAIAEVYEDEILDPDRSAETYREILVRRPTHRIALHALARIYEDRHRWKELADLLETSIDVIPDNRGKALRLWSIGLIREEHLDDRSTAARDYARALRLSPNLAPAQAALARIHEDAGEMPQLFDLLATNLDHAKNPRQRATLALHLADILARRGEHMRQAAQLYERAAESPEPPLWSLWSLIRIYRLLGLRAEAGRALSRLADVTNDETFNVELHLALGTAGLHGGLGDPLPHLKEAREANVARAFAERASEFYLRTPGRDIESEAKLLPLLQDRAQKLRDPFERACAWTEIGDRQRTMDDAAGAESAYLTALEHMGGHLVAIDGLGSIFREQSRWVELAELLEREAATLESTPNIASAFFQAGELWEEKVEDTRRAAALYERALQVQNGHLEAYTRLRALHEKKNEWAELATLMRTQITATSEAQSVGEMFRDLGRVYLDHLGQPRKAEACLRRVVDLIPFDTYALLTLANLYADRGKWDAAEDAYSQAEAILVDADLRHHVHLRLAEVYQALRDPTRAFAAFQRALADTHHADVALIADAADAARAANQPREEANLLERLADATIEPDKQIAFRKTVAQIAEDRLDDDDRAIRALQQVLAIDPLDIDATEQLAAIYGRRGSRSAVHQHLQAAVSHHRAELASQRPFDPILYHHLGRIFRWQRLFDRLYCSCVILSQLDAIPDSEARFAQDHHRRCAILPAAPLAPQRFERLILPPEVQSPLRPFLRDAGPSLRKLIAEKPSHLGLSRSSRVAPKAPLYLAVTKLAEILGFEAFEVWVNAKEPEVVAPVYFSAPALILGSAVAERISASTPADRFRIAHALFLLTEGALFLQDRSVRGIQALLGALGSLAQPEMTVPLMSASADDVAAELPALTKALGRKERRQIGALLELLAPHLATIDVGAFARGLAFGATRAGLVLAGDPGEGLRQSLINLGDLDGPHSDAIADAFNYLVSEEYFTLRIELGLAPGSA